MDAIKVKKYENMLTRFKRNVPFKTGTDTHSQYGKLIKNLLNEKYLSNKSLGLSTAQHKTSAEKHTSLYLKESILHTVIDLHLKELCNGQNYLATLKMLQHFMSTFREQLDYSFINGKMTFGTLKRAFGMVSTVNH